MIKFPRSVQPPPRALAAHSHPSASPTGLTALQAGSIGLEALHRKPACGFLLRAQGALELSSLAFCAIPCVNRIKSHPWVLFYDNFSPTVFFSKPQISNRPKSSTSPPPTRNKLGPKVASSMVKSYRPFRVLGSCHLRQGALMRSQTWLRRLHGFPTPHTVASWHTVCLQYLLFPSRVIGSPGQKLHSVHLRNSS